MIHLVVNCTMTHSYFDILIYLSLMVDVTIIRHVNSNLAYYMDFDSCKLLTFMCKILKILLNFKCLIKREKRTCNERKYITVFKLRNTLKYKKCKIAKMGNFYFYNNH